MMPSVRFAFPSIVIICAALAPPCLAGQEWIADLSAGHSVHDPVQAAIGTTGMALGVRHEGAPWFFVTVGAPFGAPGLPWSALGAGGRSSVRLGHLQVGVDLGAQGFGFVDRVAEESGGGVTGEVMPLVGLRSGALTIELRTGLNHYGTLYSGETAGRTVKRMDARADLRAGAVAVSGETRYVSAIEGAYSYVGGSAAVGSERVSLSANAGTWLADAIDAPEWGITSRIRVSDGAEAHLSVHRETYDPLYWHTPRRSWSLGLSHRIGKRPVRGDLAPVFSSPDPGITFRLPLNASPSAPRVAGDFTGWREVLMTRNGDAWTVTLPVSAGVYRYAFRRADGVWFVPDGQPGRKPDGFGGFNALLIVP
jgi:hypothetical protein